jgi:hypothetical protein
MDTIDVERASRAVTDDRIDDARKWWFTDNSGLCFSSERQLAVAGFANGQLFQRAGRQRSVRAHNRFRK